MNKNPEKTLQPKYFEYLDALRCLAFLAVFYAHTGTIFTGGTLSNEFPINIWSKFTVYGSYGVNFFFVLSGFLITFLLLKEKAASPKTAKNPEGTISIRHFYNKRVLRIWPVYFMTLFFGLLILPFLISPETYAVFRMTDPHMSASAFWYNLFFSANFFQGMALGMGPLSIGILWSVCVEEQFYLVWPWIVKKFNLRMLAFVTALCITLSLLYKFLWAGDRMGNYYLPWSLAMDLGFGALLGICYFAKKTRYAVKIALITIIGSIALTATIIAVSGFSNGINKPVLLDTFRLLKTPILDGIFVLVIAFYINRTRSIQSGKTHITKRMKDRIFSSLTHLGKISYGLYAYHTTCLVITVQILFKSGILEQNVSRGAFFLTCFIAMALTIFLAEISFRFFEKRFLAMKGKI
jgi:peptidoglycan/LPS O-acetylase OafA/YrhL